MATLTSSTLKLYCWTGQFESDRPTTAQYTITKSNPDSNNTVRFEISELVQDFINITFNDDYSTIDTSCWWYYTKTNTYSDLSTPTSTTEYGLATKGYTYFEDGFNSSLSSSKLISNEYLYIPKNIKYYIPIYLGPGGVTNVIYYTKDALGNETQAGSQSFTPYNQIPTTESSSDYIQYVESAIQASKIEIISSNTSASTYSSITSIAKETIYPIFVCNTKYTNHKVSFINKFGAIQDLYFNKKRQDRLSVEKDNFVTSTIRSTTNSATYDTFTPSNIVQDVASTKSITLNTGYLREEYNETIRQLLQSENIWIRENNLTLPILVKDSNFQYKTSVNDKLVNYTINFEFAFDGINNIR
jgi:hypothetical protein|tara:strand:+ start:1389 stop:2462 length:1074 start_codon:yes stop_codon:yes gene_type:complete